MKTNPNLPLRRMNSFIAITRKKITLLVLTVFSVFFSNFSLTAQDNQGCTADCLGNVLNISTGYNQGTGTYNTPLALETNWTLVGVPSTASITLPAPCYDIVPYPSWSNFPSAQWVSPYQQSAYNVNNWPPSLGAYEFEKCFCVCKETTVNIRFEMLIDDAGEVFLDGVSIASAYSGYQFLWANRVIFNQNFTLAEGRHCLTVKLYNTSSVAMGFALQGTVTGGDLLTSACCNPTASICGTKLQDVDCDGRVNLATDPGLPGWTIQLYDALGNYIGSAVTDAQGNYCFTGLAPGVYVVSEVPQTGWIQTYPASGTYTIGLHAGDVGSAIFGNCLRQVNEPCDFRLEFDGQIDHCGINFTPIITGMPAGYYVTSYLWEFGDGQSSNTLNGIHYYDATGVYNLCLTVTIFNGEKCCTKKYCKEIRIEKRCEEGCRFDAGIKITFNRETCEYTFMADVLFAGLPITNFFWDYGDGTTGTGPVTTHHYANPGHYVVCLYIFAHKDEECCWAKFCKEISVQDCRPKSLDLNGAQGNILNTPTVADPNVKNSIVLDQNAPNPFAESTVISYEIPSTFTKAEIRITNVKGIVVKSMPLTEKGKGQVTVYGSDLKSGMYMYSLVIDGKVTESKRMVKN